MARDLIATTNEELKWLPVHDQWLSLDDVRVTDERELVLPMLIEDDEPSSISQPCWFNFIHYSYTVPRRRAALRIANVLSYEIRDEARIGGMDINGVSIDGDLLTIVGNHPVLVHARVSAPLVTLAVSDEVVDSMVYSVWFTRLFSSHRKDV